MRLAYQHMALHYVLIHEEIQARAQASQYADHGAPLRLHRRVETDPQRCAAPDVMS